MTVALVIYASIAPVLCLAWGLSIGWRLKSGRPPIASFVPSLLRATTPVVPEAEKPKPKQVLKP